MTDDFLNVIDELTVGSIIRTRLDDGTVHIERHDAHLKRLREAVAANITGGNGTATSPHRIPINADALELYQGIEQTISEWYVAENLGVPGLYPEENLRALYTHRWADGNDDAETAVRSWRGQINHMFDAPQKVPLAIACPVCKQTHWVNPQGDICANPVVLTYMRDDPIRTARVTCHGTRPDGLPCGTEWVGYDAAKELGEEIAEALDTPTGEEVEPHP